MTGLRKWTCFRETHPNIHMGLRLRLRNLLFDWSRWKEKITMPSEEAYDVNYKLKLNLGCCDVQIPGFINVDRVPPCDQIADLAGPWPWETSTVHRIIAHDVFEHLPNKIHTMNETFRVLIPGGALDLLVPTTDGRGAFQDPTHCSWWTPNDLFYFCDKFAEWQRFHVSYGITARFKLEGSEHVKIQDEVWKLRAILKAVK